MIVIINKIGSDWNASWKALALPVNELETLSGSTSRATPSIAATASPTDTPGARLKDSMTAGNWPRWATEIGPTPLLTSATVLSGTIAPDGLWIKIDSIALMSD